MTENIFIHISALLGLTVTIAFLTRLLRQPLVVAYIVAGVLGGPLFLGFTETQENFFHTFAQFGIVLLLFIIGLSLNIRHIKALGKSVAIAGILQFSITLSAGFFIMRLLGFTEQTSIFIALAITFSSTIIVSKILTEKKDLEAVYGRFVIGILLLQDIIAITLMIFLNTFGRSGGSWLAIIPVVFSKGILLLGFIILMAKFVLPVLMDRIAKSGELLFLFTVAWCFGVASLVYWAGFNIEIGAIIAGISLGASPYQREIASRIKPLRDFFIILFFIVLGSEMQLGDFQNALVPAALLSAFVLIVDPFILYFVMRAMKFTRRNSFLASITSAQVSEFGFILIFTAEELGLVQSGSLSILTMVALTTIVISSYLITYNEKIYRLLSPLFQVLGKDKYQQTVEEGEYYDAWIFGYHRIGWKICDTLLKKKENFAVVDFNPETVSKLKKLGVPAFFGDAADVEFLEELPLHKADLIISTLPAVDDQITLNRYIRKRNEKAVIISNLYESGFLADLYDSGANYVMMPHLLGGSWFSDILTRKKLTMSALEKLRQEQLHEMRLRLKDKAH